MNKFSILLSLLVLCAACNDSLVSNEEKNLTISNNAVVEEGMQRIIVSSPAEIEQLIAQIPEGDFNPNDMLPFATRSNSEELFVSLVEANRRKVMASLTPLQLDSIANDKEDLEFCPTDSVIADIRFAQLLNARREIQVGRTVYRYFPNGVAYTDMLHVSELTNIEELTSAIQVTPDNEGRPMRISVNVDFIPVHYQLVKINNDLTEGGGYGPGSGSTGGASSGGSTGGGTTGVSSASGISLSNGITIPITDIRDVNYHDNGDGNWLHRTWTGLWGRNIVAIKKFSSSRKLTMNFYDQNYIVYANIGTELKMQKRVCGLWWNTKAEEMVQGWETVTIKFTIPEPTLPQFTSPFTGKNEYPTHAWNPFSFGSDNVLLLTIPFIDFDFTTSDLNKAFNAGLNLAWNKAVDAIKELVNNDKSKTGLMIFENKDAYIIHGPYSQGCKNKKTMETKFYAKWLPGQYAFGFSCGSTIKFKDIKFSGNDGVELYRGRVFGAIKYDGKWVGARITKTRD